MTGGFFRDSPGPVGRPRVKICGITTAEDAADAIDAGADALGFNFFRGSRRYLDVPAAKQWLTEVPDLVTRIAVLVDPTEEEAIQIAALPFIDGLQLHGNESPEFCGRLNNRGIRFCKAFVATDQTAMGSADRFHTRTVLLDSASGHGFGGSGQTFPWTLARDFIQRFPRIDFVLAGGLTPENVGVATRQARPYAVDVATGVEARPGLKDPARVRAFIEAARAVL